MGKERIAHKNLAEFIARLDAAGELVRITKEVNPILEITEITDRVSKSAGGGKALLFENVTGSSFPVLMNGFGSNRRMAMALGVDNIEEISSQIEALLHMTPPEGMMDKLRLLPTLLEVAKFPPKNFSGNAPCQEVVITGDAIDLSILPVLQCWPDDAGRFITFPLVFTKGLDGRRNLGMYRVQLFDKKTTGMHWHIHKDGAHQFHEYRKAGKRMDVAVCIGSDPAVTYAATAPLPRGVDELLLAGLIRKKPVELVKCKTVDIMVPAEAEFVLEGYVDPQEEFALEGPFGDHTGYYSLAGMYPKFHVTAITHRKKPTYFSTIVGKPPMEDCYMAKATGTIFLPMLQTVTPEVKNYDLPWEGVFHNCVIVAMEKEFPAAAHRLMNALWGTGQMSFAKMILAVDEDVDVTDHEALFEIFLNSFDITQDIFLSEGALDVLDHSSPDALRGSKLGLDSTHRLSGEKERNWGELEDVNETLLEELCKIAGAKEHKLLGKSKLNRVLILSIDKTEAGQAAELGRQIMATDVRRVATICLVVDGSVSVADTSVVTWKLFNNVDPRRDICIDGDRVWIDATKKLAAEGHEREWPDEIIMDETTIKRIDKIWRELEIEG